MPQPSALFPAPILLECLRDYLIDVGLVRNPDVAGDLPPLFIEPRDGAPAPGDKTGAQADQGIVLSAFFTGGIPHRPMEASVLRTDTVDIWIRVAYPSYAAGFEPALRVALVDRQNWDMGGLRVVDSQEWRPYSRLGSDASGWTWIFSLYFQRYRDPQPAP